MATFRPIMVLGSGSHVGKSFIAAGLCRALRNRGLKVAPFKAQNMALNSGVGVDGGEMGRAQITQAMAAGLAPRVEMNPILLKPTSDQGSQVIVMGKPIATLPGREYFQLRRRLLPVVMRAYHTLAQEVDVVVMEGAGSCAELNLKRSELVNMAMARRVGAVCALVVDIDAGGVFAQAIGTIRLLSPAERRRVEGIIINKFRGDISLFEDGVEIIEKKAGKRVLGVVPYIEGLVWPQEDGVAIERGELAGGKGMVRVGVVRVGHISNFTDFDALRAEPAVELRWVETPEQLAGLDALILPGTKNTIGDLRGMRETGLVDGIRAFHALGGKVVGFCGGLQMLGQVVADPEGVDGTGGEVEGIGLLDIATVMRPVKTTARVRVRTSPWMVFGAGLEATGYEIHMGTTRWLGASRPATIIVERDGVRVEKPEGQVSEDGRVVGSYVHGLLGSDQVRAGFIRWASGGQVEGAVAFARVVEQQLEAVGRHIEEHVDVEALLKEV